MLAMESPGLLTGHNCKVATTALRIAAIGVEEGLEVLGPSSAPAAHRYVHDSSDAALFQHVPRQCGDIDVGLRSARAVDEGAGVRVGGTELLDDLLAHFEAADADGRAEPGASRGRIEGALLHERVERGDGDALHGAAPAGVDVGDDTVRVVDACDRQAVGDLDGESTARLIRPERVARVALTPTQLPGARTTCAPWTCWQVASVVASTPKRSRTRRMSASTASPFNRPSKAVVV